MELLLPDSEQFGRIFDELLFAESYNPNYSGLGIEYYREYNHTVLFEDLSFILLENKCPVLAYVASIHTSETGITEVGAFGQSSLCIESSKGLSSKKSVQKILKKTVQRYIEKIEKGCLRYHDFLSGNSLSALGLYLMAQGARVKPLFDQVIDLTRDSEQLKQGVRRRYKSLINWGLNNLDIHLYDSSNASFSALSDFRKLHFHVAGRKTRSKASWELQYRMIQTGKAFLVLGYLDDFLVTGAFFIMNKQSCYYGVSASNRDLFDKPLSHAIIWTAILYAKKQGCAHFIMGQQQYPGDIEPKPTPKELGISTFKKGFGGKTKVSMEMQLSREKVREGE